MQRAGFRQRALGATLALLVQASFLYLVIISPSRPSRPLASLEHETILLLHSLPRTAPATIDARGPVSAKTRKAVPIIIPAVPPSAALPLAPPSGLSGFGQALFGCAPEHYGDLTPDERTHCPEPAEGMAKNDDKDLDSELRSHAKYEARWQEQWDEDHWVPAPCLPTSENTVAQCLLDQSIAENRKMRVAWSKIAEDEAAAQRTKFPPMPPIFHRLKAAP